MKKGKLDFIDRKIIDLLQYDARMSYTEIGNIVGLSRTSVKNRIIELEEGYFIKGYSAISNISKLEKTKGVPFFITVNVKPEYYKKAKEKLSEFTYFIGIFGIESKSKIICLGLSKCEENIEQEEKSLFIECVELNAIEGIVSINMQMITDWIRGEIVCLYSRDIV